VRGSRIVPLPSGGVNQDQERAPRFLRGLGMPKSHPVANQSLAGTRSRRLGRWFLRTEHIVERVGKVGSLTVSLEFSCGAEA
jgi:hypothetical protein